MITPESGIPSLESTSLRAGIRSEQSPPPDRRAAVEPVIGHLKADHRMARNYLKGRHGDRANAVLAAAGYNFALLLRWLERILRALIAVAVRRLLPA